MRFDAKIAVPSVLFYWREIEARGEGTSNAPIVLFSSKFGPPVLN
jgi:hypothetical protein